MDILKYKGYEGTAELDMERRICRGKILFINDLVIYEAGGPGDLQQAFEEAVDDYLKTCADLEMEPQKPLKGQFNVRVHPELHKAAIIRAHRDGMKLNELVNKAISAYVNTTVEVNHTYNFTVVSPEKDLNAWVSNTDRSTQFIGGMAHAAH